MVSEQAKGAAGADDGRHVVASMGAIMIVPTRPVLGCCLADTFACGLADPANATSLIAVALVEAAHPVFPRLEQALDQSPTFKTCRTSRCTHVAT
jgi:hypothetical protein